MRNLIVLFFSLIHSTLIYGQIDADSVQVRVSLGYRSGGVKNVFLGCDYRSVWELPIKMPVFDLEENVGELVEKQRDYTRYSVAINLKNTEGKSFVLKSIDKSYSEYFPSRMGRTLISFLIEDQTSSAHPYAPLTIPTMAEKIGILHFRPELFFVPVDTGFGTYMGAIAGKPSFFESRSVEDLSGAVVKRSDTLVDTDFFLKALSESSDNSYDVQAYARARLFDMFIGDWRRHELQWLWLLRSDGERTTFYPVSVNHEHAYFNFDGVVPFIIRRSGVGNFPRFNEKLRNIRGLNKSAASLDRQLLWPLSRGEWRAIAGDVQRLLTDSLIENAIRQMPDLAFNNSGGEIIQKLKNRRDELIKVAEKYQQFLSNVANIVGSDSDDVFTVTGTDNDGVYVSVSRFRAGEDREYMGRHFSAGETKEIRLFGTGGNDVFKIDKSVGKKIRIRIIGGEGIDTIQDNGSKRIQRRLFVYDPGDDTIYDLKGRFHKRSVGEVIDSLGAFDRMEYNPNRFGIQLFPEFNRDDGLFIGLSLVRKTYSFMNYPYSTRQRIGGNFATATNAFNIKYVGDFKNVIGPWSLNLDAGFIGPQFAFNYFGMGNETRKEEDINFYRIRAREYLASAWLYRNLSKRIHAGFGPMYQYMEIEPTEGRFVSREEAEVSTEVFDPNQFIAARAFVRYSSIDNIVYPSKGVMISFEAAGFNALTGNEQFINLKGSIAYYLKLPLPVETVFASRVGGGHNIGEFLFFQANNLGGTTNLRGYRRQRFYGRTSFYHNNEVRVKLANINMYLFPLDIGGILFMDYGRVWADGEKSVQWHTGYGPGLYAGVFHRWVFSATYGFSEDRNYINVNVGFLF
ncbi:MAG: BamA/TamA family outer membrane protein [Cytophagaceae bacterium]